MFNIVIMLLSLSLVYSQKAFSYRCHDHERSALLQFKQTFTIDINLRPFGCGDSSYSNISSWNSSKDCCMWDGIDCNEDTGHVIGLDLSCSHLFGSINSNSSLFHLVHLQRLNLACNDFNSSEIPTGLVHLAKLTYLNLSYSYFSGQVPREISHLSMLSSLDLSENLRLSMLSFLDLSRNPYALTMDGSNFKSLIQNLTSIKQLILRGVDMELTVVPEILANLSSTLTTLNLAHCGLRGEFPGRVFNLPNLHYLNLFDNLNLTGYLPEFHSGNTLNHLVVSSAGFSGKLPDSLVNLSQLIELDLSFNNFGGHAPSSIGNLSMLTTLNLRACNFWGPIPSSFYQLKNLEILNLHGNQLSGTVDLDLFLLMKNLSFLSLSDNSLSVISSSTHSNTNTTIAAQLEALHLESCKLTKIPEFLRNQTKLSELRLWNNSIQGLIPAWIFNSTSLKSLDLSYNSLTGFPESPVFNPDSKLQDLLFNDNRLKGSLPIPPPSVSDYDVSNNALEGEISPLIRNLTSLYTLKLEGNNFGGTIPDIWTNGCNLEVMMLSENQFEGELPRSLANCTDLEILDVGNNQIKDTFPFWLETLPELKVLLLRFNKFSGAIRDPDHQNRTAIFPKLHIADLSHNSFSGHLPSGYFQIWDAMKFFKVHDERVEYIYLPITVTNKGTARDYWFIQNSLNLLDLSSNRFEGEIPELIGNLQGLQSLNLSNNFLTGPISSSLGNLSQIEALDLSHNMLSGEIPQQLPQLNFLEIFSVAHNNLTGPIPNGEQFDTFLESSFEGNAGLCGKPLSEECGNSKDSPPSSPTVDEDEEVSPLEFDWKPVVIGCGCGIVIGVVFGHFVIDRRYDWFVHKFGIRLPK